MVGQTSQSEPEEVEVQKTKRQPEAFRQARQCAAHKQKPIGGLPFLRESTTE